MASGIAETAKLLVSLELKDNLSKGISSAGKSLSGLEARVGRVGKIAGQGMKTAGANLAKIGAVAAVGIGAAVKQGIDNLATLESAVTSVDGAITQMGLTGQVTGTQVAGWANEIEASVQAAFDDKDITAATTTLLRYGSVTPKNLRRTMVVMTDLAARTGDVTGSANMLGKALADPAKAAGKLARAGIVLTKEQQDQIKAMVKAGDVTGAQAYLLTQLETRTTGAAAAMNGPYRDAMLTLGDVTEDAQKALAVGFLPVLQRVAGKLSTALADRKVLANIEGFGRTLADAFDSAITIAERLPWGTIGASLQLAGASAKAVLGAFTSMPPWVQTAVITGWGLNKLTGGALGKIFGELTGGIAQSLGKSLFQRGGTPATPLFTKEVGLGGAGGIGGAGKVAGGIGMLGMGALAAEAAVLAAMVYSVWDTKSKELNVQATRISGQTASFIGQATPEDLRKSLSGLLQQQRDLNGDLVKSIASTIFPQGRDQLADSISQIQAALDAQATKTTEVTKEYDVPPQRLSAQAEGVLKRAIESGYTPSQHAIQRTLERNIDRTREAAEETRKAAVAAAIRDQAQSLLQGFANLQLATIAAKDTRPVVTVPITVYSTFSVRGMTTAQNVRAVYNRGGTTVASGNRRGQG